MPRYIAVIDEVAGLKMEVSETGFDSKQGALMDLRTNIRKEISDCRDLLHQAESDLLDVDGAIFEELTARRVKVS